MQNTRLNSLVDSVIGQFDQWLRNPWRRLSVMVISLLFGNFSGSAIATTTGARADWDILSAVIAVLLIEAMSWLAYRRNRDVVKPLLVEILNSFKIGFTYSLFLDAFKLGS